jgi:hypothetical protein
MEMNFNTLHRIVVLNADVSVWHCCGHLQTHRKSSWCEKFEKLSFVLGFLAGIFSIDSFLLQLLLLARRGHFHDFDCIYWHCSKFLVTFSRVKFSGELLEETAKLPGSYLSVDSYGYYMGHILDPHFIARNECYNCLTVNIFFSLRLLIFLIDLRLRNNSERFN